MERGLKWSEVKGPIQVQKVRRLASTRLRCAALGRDLAGGHIDMFLIRSPWSNKGQMGAGEACRPGQSAPTGWNERGLDHGQRSKVKETTGRKR